MPDDTSPSLFQVFNEIGIIEQLSRAILEARLPHGLIAPHFTVLNHLTRVGDGRTPVELARAFQIPKTSITHTLKGLADRDLVELRPNPEDGRSKRVWLTPQGSALRNDVIAQLSKDFEHLAERFDVGPMLAMLPDLRALRIFLDENRDVTGTAHKRI